MMKRKFSKLSIFIFIFFAVTVLLPLINMLCQVEWSSFSDLISSDAFKESLINSLIVTSVSTIISIFLAYIIAYTLNRTNIKHKAVLKLLLTLPMLIPSISHGLGLINLFGTNGLISKIFGFNIIGPSGIIIGSVLYSFPVALLMIDDGFKYINNNMYNVGKVLGFNKFQMFKRITMCYMKKSILSCTFAIFTLIFTDYGIPLSVGGKFNTLPVFLYKEVIGLLDFSKGTMIGLFLLIPAIVSFIFDLFSKDYGKSENNKENDFYETSKILNIILKIVVYIVIIIIISIIGSFVYYAFVDNPKLNNTISLEHFKYVFETGLIKNLFNSLLISICVSIFGTIIAYFSAYVTSRMKPKFCKLIHVLTIVSLAIPGIILGLSYIVTFKNTFIYNTFIILIMVNIIHFIATPYLMAYNALKKLNSNYEVVAKTCNIGFLNLLVNVIIPLTKQTIREMFSYFFVNSMITISAVAFLFNTNNMPLSLMINNYESNLMLGEAAIVSLIILLVNSIVKLINYFINRIEKRRMNENEFNN